MTSLQELINQLPDSTPSKNGAQSIKWGDAIFKQLSVASTIYKQPALKEAILIAKTVLNLYVGQTPATSDWDEVLILPTLSLSLKKSKTWVDFVSLRTQDVTPTRDYTLATGSVSKITDGYANGSEYFYAVQIATAGVSQLPGTSSGQTSTSGISVGLTDVSAFYNKVWTLLESEGLDDQRNALNIMGYLCLMCSRCLTKESSSIAKAVTNRAYSSFKGLFNYDLKMVFPPPHKHFVEKITQHVSRLSEPGLNLIINLTSMAYPIFKAPGVNSEMMGILQAGCFLHNSYVGLHLISLAMHVTALYRIPMKTLVSMMAFKIYNTSITNLVEGYLRIYKAQSDPANSADLLLPWCRLFGDNYELSYNASNNISFVTVLASLIDNKEVDSTIWDLRPLSRNDLTGDTLKLSQVLIQHLSPELGDAETDEARDIATQMATL